MAPILVPCLVTLRGEFNRLAPGRDLGADGWIGDKAHQLEPSDHNGDETGRTPFEDADHIDEVHAIDIDSTGPWPAGHSLDQSVETVRLNHLHGRDDRLQNIIWRDRVASRTWGWTWQNRPGIGHFDHAHFSARYTTAQEQDTSPWGVYDEELPVKPEDFYKLMDGWAKTPNGKAALATTSGDIVTDLLESKLGHGTVTVAQALQNTEANTRGLPAKLDALAATDDQPPPTA
jgi:hypothetical protein